MGVLRDIISGGALTGEEDKTINLRTLFDPADVLGMHSASEQAKAAEALQARATNEAIRQQEQMYQRGLEYMSPYRAYGMRALPGLQASLQPGSQLGMMRENIGQQQLPQVLSQKGFGPEVIDALMGKYMSAIGAEESTARTSRARDLMNLGMGGAGMASELAGQQGGGLANLYLQGAQMQGQQAINQALARRQQGMGTMYGGYQGLMNYLGGAYNG